MTRKKLKTSDQTKMEWKAITLSANLGGGEWSLKEKENEFKAIAGIKIKCKTLGAIAIFSTLNWDDGE
jgi:hypothetical protein